MQAKKQADRERELLEERNNQEANIKSMLERMQQLDRSAMDTSAMLDRSSLTANELPQNIQAVVDHDSHTVTLINTDSQGRQYKMKQKIRLVSSDASFLQDTSQLDASHNASYIVGDIFDQNRLQSQNTANFDQKHSNIFGGMSSASPSSSPQRKHGGMSNAVPMTPALGGHNQVIDFGGDGVSDASFVGNDHDTSRVQE